MGVPVGCFYCGKVCPWFQCDCRWVREIRAGGRAKPRVRIIDGRTIIVLDAETVERNVLGMVRYGEALALPAPEKVPDEAGAEEVVVELASSAEELPKRSRAAYMRDFRARRKGGGG